MQNSTLAYIVNASVLFSFIQRKHLITMTLVGCCTVTGTGRYHSSSGDSKFGVDGTIEYPNVEIDGTIEYPNVRHCILGDRERRTEMKHDQ
jgi:hypothetical protein